MMKNLFFLLLVLALVLGGLEKLFASVYGVSIWRKSRIIDLVYWFFTPLCTRALSQIILLFILARLAGLFGHTGDVGAFFWSRYQSSVFMDWPQWLQVLAAVAVTDFTAYWVHRVSHASPFWRFHAIHHSSQELNWLSASRVHPVYDLVLRIIKVTPLALLGFHPLVLVKAIPILTIWAVFIHSNLSWGFGPLKYVITTPRFHRWHHAASGQGRAQNLAGFFPVLDLAFGTFFLPRNKMPTRFGTPVGEVPETLWGQLIYPIRPLFRFKSRTLGEKAIRPPIEIHSPG
jgi:sterol desaturase/sphingolipid hydroxylase (fatty acid hydroxylase superfamily)